MDLNVIAVIAAVIIVFVMFIMHNSKEKNQKEITTIQPTDVKESTEIELTRELVRLQRLQVRKTNRMLNNVLWFFWLSIIYLIGSFIIFMNYI